MIKDFLIRHNIIKGEFTVDAFIYVDYMGHPTNMITERIKWLHPLTITCYKKELDKEAFKILNSTYPNYKGYFNLY